jgi:hypothetical protein
MRIQPKTESDRRHFALANLKRCPLCGAVNAHLNHECFACGWYGKFDHDPESVEEGLQLLMDRCPELATPVPITVRRPGLLGWLSGLVSRIWPSPAV